MSGKSLSLLLYVDDDPDIREIVQMSLSLDGDLNVLLSDGGERALTKMRVEQPDLVMLDVMMPGMDGRTIAAAMKTDSVLSAVPFVFMTAKARAQDAAELCELGALGIISKPFDLVGLPREVRNLLAKSRV